MSNYGKVSAFIDENVAENSYLSGAAGIYPEMTFKFVPCLPMERAKIVEDTTAKPEDEVCRAWVSEIAKRIRSWSLDLKPTEENILKLKPILLAKFSAIVIYGNSPGDPHPTFYQDGVLEAKSQDENQENIEKN